MILRSLVALLTLTGAASAQTLSPDEAALLPRLIDSACLEIVEANNGCEQVILLASETVPDAADLVILTDWRGDPPSVPLAIVRNVAFNGVLWGMEPSMTVTERGSLVLSSQQTGIGRTPWTQDVTIAHRDGAFVVAGITYGSYDRAVGGEFTCDVNLLTGDFAVSALRPDPEDEEATITVHSSSGRGEAIHLPLSDLTIDTPLPAPCLAGLDAWWAAAP